MTSKIANSVTICALALMAIPASVTAGDWTWSLTPYGWAAGMSYDVKVNEREIIDGEVEFKNLLDATEAGLMLYFEGRKDKFGLFVDLIAINLGGEATTRDDRLIPVNAEANLDAKLLHIGGIFYPGGEGSGFGVSFGLRVVDVGQEIAIVQVGDRETDLRFEVDETLVDGLLGLRYYSHFAESWPFAIWADASTGGTELTWSATAVVGYNFGKRDQFGIRIGYTHLVIELDDKAELIAVESQIAMSGPMVGFLFAF